MKYRTGLLALLLGAIPALAENYIEVFGGTEDVDYVRYQFTKRVKIMTPGTYIVRATNGPGQLGDINRIYVESASAGSVAGKITVSVYDWDEGPQAPGAQKVAWVDFANAIDGGRIGVFRVTGDYGDVDPLLGGPMLAIRADTIEIGGNVVAPPGTEAAINITPWVSGSVVLGNVKSPVNLPTVSGDVTIHDVEALVTLRRVWGKLTIAGTVTAPLDCSGNGGDVHLTAPGVTHTGSITLNTVPRGHTFWCNASLSDSSRLSIQKIEPQALVQIEQNAGVVYVAEVSGDAQVGGVLAINGNVKDLEALHVLGTGAVYVGGSVTDALVMDWSGDLTLGSLTHELIDCSPISGRAYIGAVSGSLRSNGVTGRLGADDLTSSGKLDLAGDVTGTLAVEHAVMQAPALPSGRT